MPRHGAPDHNDPQAFAGLRQRQQRAAGMATTQSIGDSLIDQGWTAKPDPDDPRSTIFIPPPDEAGGMSTSDGLGA
jgi:hypothetical protein